MPDSSNKKIIIVPHTHWDREWYEPHDIFRLRLVHMIDGLLDLLENQRDYKFTLDGQAAAIEDYLEMRPEMRPRIVRAIKDGQLAIGPFLILLDEFCCDGETIIRNLELGIKASRELGHEMRVGYLPDMFGHAAQTPQILAGFGIQDASLWRGVPDAIRDHAFTWEALNGQSVRCQYLFDGYGNGLDLFAVEGQLPQLAKDYLEKTESWYGSDNVLAMLGSDHTPPKPDLLDVIKTTQHQPGSPQFEVETIDGYIRQASRQNLSTVRGELRSHARGNLLPGVFSIRTNMKQSMANAERTASIAERLDALYPSADHKAFLDTAWYRIVESTAHDSVTGCGVDETAEQVVTRLHTATYIARGVIESAQKEATKAISANDHLLINTSAYPRVAHAEITVSGGNSLPNNSQLIEELPTILGDEIMSTKDLVKLLRRIHGRELFGGQINGYQWSEDRLQFFIGEVAVGEFDLANFTAELEQKMSNSSPEKKWNILTVAEPRSRHLVQVKVSGLGQALASQNSPATDVVSVSENGLSNSAIDVVINGNGTIDMRAEDFFIAEALKLSDEGDRGDSYNFGPLKDTSPITEPIDVSIKILERGPLRGKIEVLRKFELPIEIDQTDRNRRSGESNTLIVRSILELRSEEKFLRVTTKFTNTVKDHRLRILLPVGSREIASTFGAGQYGVTERGRTSEGGWGEFPLPTYPATQFVSAGNSTVLLDKLTEYELVTPSSGADQLAITLLRAVGMMSVNVHPLRDEPAGSEFEVPEAQYIGTEVSTSFAILPSPKGWEIADAPRHADLFRFPTLVARGSSAPEAKTVLTRPAVSVETTGHIPLVSLRNKRKEDGSIDRWEARFVNYSNNEYPLSIVTEDRWRETNLIGEEITSEDSTLGNFTKDSPEIAGSTILTLVTTAEDSV